MKYESDRFLSFPNGDKLSSNSLDDDEDETSIDTTCEEPELCHRQESGSLITEHDEFASSVEQKVDIIEQEFSSIFKNILVL
ncbi:hypothetical protein HK100_010111 [Physocladia obscura]|uniref:Uncharacterized protein n=1 Tax=Physocladia obscura TaxID=109957 RepID=A0AAD5XDX9_9FUNG|nr:hypothetical protein HK100_010111 [Physocladia obscura]